MQSYKLYLGDLQIIVQGNL